MQKINKKNICTCPNCNEMWLFDPEDVVDSFIGCSCGEKIEIFPVYPEDFHHTSVKIGAKQIMKNKDIRKKIYEKAFEIVKVVNNSDSALCQIGVKLEFDDDTTIIGKTMNVLFSNPKDIICDVLGLQLKRERGYIVNSDFFTMLDILYPESGNANYSILEEDMFSTIDAAANNEEFIEKLWLCFVGEDIEAKKWLKEHKVNIGSVED